MMIVERERERVTYYKKLLVVSSEERNEYRSSELTQLIDAVKLSIHHEINPGWFD